MRDLVFVRNKLGSGGLSGCLHSLASAPALQPRFCLLSLRCLRLLLAGMVIHWEPGHCAMPAGILCRKTCLSHFTHDRLLASGNRAGHRFCSADQKYSQHKKTEISIQSTVCKNTELLQLCAPPPPSSSSSHQKRYWKQVPRTTIIHMFMKNATS